MGGELPSSILTLKTSSLVIWDAGMRGERLRLMRDKSFSQEKR